MAWLSVQQCSKIIQNETVVNNVSFTVQALEKIAIAGATGSGKTTLLKMMASLVQPSSGSIVFNNQPVVGPNNQLLPGHKGIAYLSQHFELRNNYFVHELLEMANKMHPSEAANIYKVCRVNHLLQRKSNELSGGEKQRIVLASLLTTKPQLLLLDEPYSNLDMVHKQIMKQVIDDIGQQLHISCMLISHEPADVLSWADRVLIMQNGYLVQQGTPQQVYTQPTNTYVAGLLGMYNLIDAANAAGFNSLNPIPPNKQMLLRPEHIRIEPASNIFQKDTIQKIVFWGGFYTIDVLVNTQIVTVKVLQHNFEVGNRVVLTVDAKYLLYI
jgi:ABC-type glutathione transport system ATPase component